MGKSSKDKRDIYYRLAKEQGYRARSAYKLLQLNERFDLFSNVTRVVDLCAAPGSWSQVLSQCLVSNVTNPSLKEQPKIVAVDLQSMSPLPGVITLQADITHPSTLSLLLKHLQSDTANTDLVISDGAPDVTGLHDLDEFVQAQLILAALNLATCVLRPGGTFVAKIFRGRDADEMYCQFRGLFERVTFAKPSSSRESSNEAFIVCERYSPPDGFEPSLERPLTMTVSSTKIEEVTLDDEFRFVPSFLACGDLSAWDEKIDEKGIMSL